MEERMFIQNEIEKKHLALTRKVGSWPCIGVFKPTHDIFGYALYPFDVNKIYQLLNYLSQEHHLEVGSWKMCTV